MKDPLALFPARIAIGSFYNDAADPGTGKPIGRVDIIMTPEFFRALRDVLLRVGGASSGVDLDAVLTEVFAPFSAADSDVSNPQDMLMSLMPALQDLVAQMVATEMTQYPRTTEPDFMSEMVMAPGEETDPTP